MRGFRTRHARIIQAKRQPCQPGTAAARGSPARATIWPGCCSANLQVGILDSSRRPSAVADVRSHEPNHRAMKTRYLPQIESRFPIDFPDSARSPYQRAEDNCRADIPSAPPILEIKPQQHTDGVSFAENLSRLKPQRQLFAGSAFFSDAPHWHNACTCRWNGSEHETSRTQHSDDHPVSLASRAASRRIIPGLWRARRIGTAAAPSLKYYGDGRAGQPRPSCWGSRKLSPRRSATRRTRP